MTTQRRPPKQPEAQSFDELARKVYEASASEAQKMRAMSPLERERARVSALLERLRKESGDGPLQFSGVERSLLVRSLGNALAYADELELEARALHAMIGVPVSRQYEAYARARGVEVSDDNPRHGKYYAPRVLRFYLDALSSTEDDVIYMTPMVDRLAGLPAQALRLEPGPRTPKQAAALALKVTTEFFAFPSEDACRRQLVRWRVEIRGDRTGWRAAFDPDFQIPGYDPYAT